MKLPTISPQNVHRLKGLKSKLKLYIFNCIKTKVCKLDYYYILFIYYIENLVKRGFFSYRDWKLCPTQRTEFFVPPVRSATPLPCLPVCHSPSRWYQWGPLQQRTSETCLSTVRPVVHPAEVRFALFLTILFC